MVMVEVGVSSLLVLNRWDYVVTCWPGVSIL